MSKELDVKIANLEKELRELKGQKELLKHEYLQELYNFFEVGQVYENTRYEENSVKFIKILKKKIFDSDDIKTVYVEYEYLHSTLFVIYGDISIATSFDHFTNIDEVFYRKSNFDFDKCKEEFSALSKKMHGH